MQVQQEQVQAQQLTNRAYIKASEDLIGLFHADYIRIRETHNASEAIRILKLRHPTTWRELLGGWRKFLLTDKRLQ